jgi:hypothetical protein
MVLDTANEIVRMSAALRDKTATHGMYCLIPVVENRGGFAHSQGTSKGFLIVLVRNWIDFAHMTNYGKIQAFLVPETS